MNIQYFLYLKVVWQHNILYHAIWKDFLTGFPTLQTERGEIEQMVRTYGKKNSDLVYGCYLGEKVFRHSFLILSLP